MVTKTNNYPSLVKEIRKQLDLSQEDLARELGVSFATVNRWENGQVRPSKLAKAQINAFCSKRVGEGRLKSDTPRRAGGLMSWAASKAVDRLTQTSR